MKPRPGDRGRHDIINQFRTFTLPLQCGHGRETVENRTTTVKPAKHTQLQLGHGQETVENGARGSKARPMSMPLQCGHGLMTTEDRIAHMVSMPHCDELQCGHGLVTVEEDDFLAEVLDEVAASMWPRPFGRGKPGKDLLCRKP